MVTNPERTAEKETQQQSLLNTRLCRAEDQAAKIGGAGLDLLGRPHLLVNLPHPVFIEVLTMPDSIRVLLADDHAVVRKGIRDILLEAGDLTVIAEATNGEEAITLIDQLRPDVAVLDIQMPKTQRHRRVPPRPIAAVARGAVDSHRLR